MGTVQNFSLSPFMQAGLRRRSSLPVNAPGMVECAGLRPIEDYLTDLPEVTSLTGVSAELPYTKIHKGKRISFVLKEQSIHPMQHDGTVGSAVPVLNIKSAISPTTESLTNPEFTTDASGWTLNPGWSHSSGGIVKASGSTNTAFQTGASMASPTVSGGRYRLVIELESYTSGTLKARLGTTEFPELECSATGKYISEVVATADNLTLTLTPSVSFAGKITSVSLKRIAPYTIPSGGGTWDVADFGDVVFFAKENCCIARLPYYAYPLGDFVYVGFGEDEGMKLPVICSLGNSLVMGGLESDIFNPSAGTSESDRWATLWRIWLESMPFTVTHKNMLMDSKTLFISTPSGGALDFPFVQEMGALGFPVREEASQDVEDAYLDVIMKREMSFLPVDWQENILQCKPLGGGVCVYCKDGISFVTPPREAGAPWGATRVREVGLAKRGAVLDRQDMHWFIDSAGMLWTLDAGLQLTPLDYREYLRPMLDNPFTMTYDDEERELYITASDVCYGLTRTGALFRLLDKFPVSVARIGDNLFGVTINTNDETFKIRFNAVDMELDEQKIIQYIGVAGYNVSDVRVRLYYRNDRNVGDSGFKALAAKRTNRSNLTHWADLGRDFSIEVTGTKSAGAKIERVLVGWRLGGKMSFEGSTIANTTTNR